jgi:hypothetical protein
VAADATDTSSREANVGRRLVFEAFRETLMDLHGRSGVTEVQFRDLWLERLRAEPSLSTNGWYEPPPDGMAVLFAHDAEVGRVGFESLRPEAFWPSATKMDWSRGVMYGYCSPVAISEGLPADFALTLYFGENRRVRRHFQDAVAVTHEVIDTVTPETESRALFDLSEALFRERGFRSNVASITDSVPVDLGHTLPRLDERFLDGNRELNAAARESVRHARRFVSESSDWPLAGAGQVTVEPRLVSREDPGLPQISLHYVLAFDADGVSLLNECDALLRDFGLIA